MMPIVLESHHPVLRGYAGVRKDDTSKFDGLELFWGPPERVGLLCRERRLFVCKSKNN